jgi:hypothetical protein
MEDKVDLSLLGNGLDYLDSGVEQLLVTYPVCPSYFVVG